MDNITDTLKRMLGDLMDKTDLDTIHVFASRHDGADGTSHWSFGRGNYLARKGQIRDWVITEDECTREYARRIVPKED